MVPTQRGLSLWASRVARANSLTNSLTEVAEVANNGGRPTVTGGNSSNKLAMVGNFVIIGVKVISRKIRVEPVVKSSM